MDIEKKGYINVQDLCTYICLLNSTLMKASECNNYKNQKIDKAQNFKRNMQMLKKLCENNNGQ